MNINVPSLLTGIGFSDIIDILLISFVIFVILNYARTSRAASLAKGIIFLVLAYFFSSLAHLYAFNWVLGQVLNVGLISLVVIFQPELRRALEYIGRGKFAKGQISMSRAQKEEFADQVVASIGYFAARKEGALIVFERETALSDIAETGTIIDARLSQELIDNIFYKGSPLHDGAAIIRNDRILAAGCVLPLTENTNLSKDLGTRHRAGIGVSETSDALVLIVSEETGIISMAMDGKLSRFLDLKTVQKTLLNYYIDRKDIKSSSVDLLTEIWRRLDGTKQS
ncbi:MAG: diadenylate cyclase CdaA [Firmicutes bacterium]|nr:diadenylate cyclase CdaA [Bacillota bacterium]MBR0441256.1 diadenylate cyclase CdaA [Bacillota bacterium]MBR0522535.1 diadenylate cyclase CdaA [Bacillota bacterium]